MRSVLPWRQAELIPVIAVPRTWQSHHLDIDAGRSIFQRSGHFGRSAASAILGLNLPDVHLFTIFVG